MLRVSESDLLPGMVEEEALDNATKIKAKRRQSVMPAQSEHAKIDVALKKKLMAEEAERTARAKRDTADERARENEEFKSSGNSTSANIILPAYERDTLLECDREINKPPESMYIGLGWDENAESGRKHYRRYFNDELENVSDVLGHGSPFNTYSITRG